MGIQGNIYKRWEYRAIFIKDGNTGQYTWDIVVFRLIAYLLNVICLILRIQNPTHIRFGIILARFYITFSRQEHQLELSRVSINS